MKGTAALLLLALASPAALALPFEAYGTCGGEAPASVACSFLAYVEPAPIAGCANDECTPGAIAIAGGGAAFTGALVVRTDAVEGQGTSAGWWNCAIVAGAGTCAPDAGPHTWPTISPGWRRVDARVVAGEGAWWAGVAVARG